MRLLFSGAVLVLAFLVAGCGKPTSRVHGTARYLGEPLTGATVVFLASDNQVYPVIVEADGSYEVVVPCGPVQVSVQAPLPRVPPRPDPGSKGHDPLASGEVRADDAGKQARSKPPLTTAQQLPADYADPSRSGLSFDLKGPDKEFVIDLK